MADCAGTQNLPCHVDALHALHTTVPPDRVPGAGSDPAARMPVPYSARVGTRLIRSPSAGRSPSGVTPNLRRELHHNATTSPADCYWGNSALTSSLYRCIATRRPRRADRARLERGPVGGRGRSAPPGSRRCGPGFYWPNSALTWSFASVNVETSAPVAHDGVHRRLHDRRDVRGVVGDREQERGLVLDLDGERRDVDALGLERGLGLVGRRGDGREHDGLRRRPCPGNRPSRGT